MTISMIVAYGENKELGLNNELLWHIPDDLKNFKEITDGHFLIMGKNTFDSIFNYIKKPLPNRTSLVLSRTSNYDFEDVYNFDSIEKSIEFAKQNEQDEIFIIGGASIYNNHFDLVNKLYISEVDFDGEADCFFEPDIDSNDWDLLEKKEYSSTETTPSWTFKIYSKKP